MNVYQESGSLRLSSGTVGLAGFRVGKPFITTRSTLTLLVRDDGTLFFRVDRKESTLNLINIFIRSLKP